MTYVKCPTCGWLHFALSAEQAMQQVKAVNQGPFQCVVMGSRR